MDGEPLSERIGEVKERESKEARRLYVVVHAQNVASADIANVDLGHRLEERFRMDKDDVMWFMPMNFDKSLSQQKTEVRKNLFAKAANPNVGDWISLYRSFKGKSPEQVMLSHEMVFSETIQSSGKQKIDDMVERTEQKGWEITNNTEVIVGGEITEWCVKNAVLAIFKSPKFNRIWIDTAASKPERTTDRAVERIVGEIEYTERWGLHAKYNQERKMVEVTRRVN